jgi:hypothetical protein
MIDRQDKANLEKAVETLCKRASENRTPDLRNASSVEWFKAVAGIDIYLPVI